MESTSADPISEVEGEKTTRKQQVTAVLIGTEILFERKCYVLDSDCVHYSNKGWVPDFSFDTKTCGLRFEK